MRAMLKVRFVMPGLALAELRPCTQLASLQHAYFDRLYAQTPVQGERHQPHWPSSRYFCSSTQNKCWQCGNQPTVASLFFCQSCKAIQPPAEAPDLFAVMGLPRPAFDLDQRQLETRYKHLQRDLHPDKFGLRDKKEQEFSAEQSSLVNHAYTLLKSPLQRALYLLQRKGVAVPEDGGTISDPELLMDVMEQREAVEETDDVDVLQDMLTANKNLELTTVQPVNKTVHAAAEIVQRFCSRRPGKSPNSDYGLAVYLNKFVRQATKQQCVKLLLDMLDACDNAAADVRTLSGCELACVSYLTARPLMR